MKTRLLCAISLLLVSMPGICGHEFEDTDIYPAPNKMDFDKDRVYFAAYPLPLLGGPRASYEWYALDRATHAITRLDAPPDEQAKGMVALPKAIGNDTTYGRSGVYEDLDLMTGDGDDYTSYIPYCGEDEEGDSRLEHSGVVLKFFSHGCTGAGALEKSGWRLLAANRYFGEGESAPSGDVSVLDTSGQQVVKTIDFGASIIRLDPFTQEVWMIGPTGVMLLDSSAEVKQRWYFYRDFGAPEHRPALLLSDKPRDSDPYAVVAWLLNIKDTEGWYKAVQALPASTRQSLNLYNYFMGGFNFGDPKYPEFVSLAPFMIGPMMADLKNIEYEKVFGVVCKSTDPRVDALLQQAEASGDVGLMAWSKRCTEERTAKKPGAR